MLGDLPPLETQSSICLLPGEEVAVRAFRLSRQGSSSLAVTVRNSLAVTVDNSETGELCRRPQMSRLHLGREGWSLRRLDFWL